MHIPTRREATMLVIIIKLHDLQVLENIHTTAFLGWLGGISLEQKSSAKCAFTRLS